MRSKVLCPGAEVLTSRCVQEEGCDPNIVGIINTERLIRVKQGRVVVISVCVAEGVRIFLSALAAPVKRINDWEELHGLLVLRVGICGAIVPV